MKYAEFRLIFVVWSGNSSLICFLAFHFIITYPGSRPRPPKVAYHTSDVFAPRPPGTLHRVSISNPQVQVCSRNILGNSVIAFGFEQIICCANWPDL
jgi:hypothetical protein